MPQSYPPQQKPMAKCDICGKIFELSSFARCAYCGRATCYYCLTVKTPPKYQCFQCAMGLTDASSSMGEGEDGDIL
jgi:hypothetical protein